MCGGGLLSKIDLATWLFTGIALNVCLLVTVTLEQKNEFLDEGGFGFVIQSNLADSKSRAQLENSNKRGFRLSKILKLTSKASDFFF